LELRPSRMKIDPSGGARLERHLVGGHLAGNFVELAGVGSDGAALLHLGRDAAAEADLHVGGRRGDLVAVGLDQHVGQERLWGPALHDALYQVQAMEQILTLDADLHAPPRVRGSQVVPTHYRGSLEWSL